MSSENLPKQSEIDFTPVELKREVEEQFSVAQNFFDTIPEKWFPHAPIIEGEDYKTEHPSLYPYDDNTPYYRFTKNGWRYLSPDLPSERGKYREIKRSIVINNEDGSGKCIMESVEINLSNNFMGNQPPYLTFTRLVFEQSSSEAEGDFKAPVFAKNNLVALYEIQEFLEEMAKSEDI